MQAGWGRRPCASLRLPLTQPPSGSSGTARTGRQPQRRPALRLTARPPGTRGAPRSCAPHLIHPAPSTPNRTPAAAPLPERPIPGVGRGEMLWSRRSSAWDRKGCSERALPSAGSRGDARKGRSPVRDVGGCPRRQRKGRGAGAAGSHVLGAASPLLNRPVGRAPPPLSRRPGRPSPGGGNTGIRAVPARPAPPLAAPQDAVTCRRSVTPLTRPLSPSAAAAALHAAPTPRQGDPGWPQHRPPRIPPPPALPGAARAGRRGYFQERTHKARGEAVSHSTRSAGQ